MALKQVMDSNGTRVVGLLGAGSDLNSAAISSNLAFLNARSGWRTLLIELDTARPNLSAQFAANKSSGLQDLVSGRASVAEAVLAWTKNPKLHLLLAKSTDVVWTSEEVVTIKSVIEQLSDQYDVVFVHLPHVNSPNRALSALTDVVIVSRAGQTAMPVLLDAAADLRLAGKHPLGVIMSDLV